jgi:predicted nucleotidyltransferase
VESPIQLNLDEIARVCRQHQVRRLIAFGSILRPDFNEQKSDADFLVEFEPLPAALRMRRYLSLQADLHALLRRPVDLVEDGAIQNPYILKRIKEHQRVLYAA